MEGSTGMITRQISLRRESGIGAKFPRQDAITAGGLLILLRGRDEYALFDVVGAPRAKIIRDGSGVDR